MGLLLLVAAAVAWWAWKDGSLRTLRYADVAAAVAGLVGLRLFSHGNPILGAVALAGAGGWLWLRMRAPRGIAMTADEASALLEIAPGADPAAIRAAHRRLITLVHPDRGGSTDLARRVNIARDTLLAAAKP